MTPDILSSVTFQSGMNRVIRVVREFPEGGTDLPDRRKTATGPEYMYSPGPLVRPPGRLFRRLGVR